MGDAYACALRLLARREHGAEELLNKLTQKGFSELEARETVETCQNLGLQSDLRYAENVFRSRIRQGYGPVRIEQQLRQANVNIDVIAEARALVDEDWLVIAQAVREKKFKLNHDVSYEMLQKQKQFLRYRGFPTDIINQVYELLEN